MIHVKNLSMDVSDDLQMFEKLMNDSHLEKVIKILDIDKAFDNRGVMHIFLVYKDVETTSKLPVKFDAGEFPPIDYGNNAGSF